uniref:Tetrahydrofolate dehydrogenase/cyclohydrolase NAD(P)-binding domain-containing protein n=1 Tax=Micrurus surinamensis TaxID=129470 RepID=A0A2D4NSF5_MICSU
MAAAAWFPACRRKVAFLLRRGGRSFASQTEGEIRVTRVLQEKFPQAVVIKVVDISGIPTLGKNVVVAGRSKNVGMPIAMLLHTDGRHERPGGDATVTISHRYTPKEQLKQHTILADIVVAAAGIPNLITADMIKEGAAVIDVGINRIQDPVTAKPKLVGDVDFEGVKQKASYITPVPGGVGPMTVAMLMKNTIIAAKKMLRAQHLETFSA